MNIDPTRVRPPTRRRDLRHVIPPYYIRGDVCAMEVIEGCSMNFNIGCVVKYLCRAGHKPDETVAAALTKARHALWRELRLQRPDSSHEGWEGTPFALPPGAEAPVIIAAWELGTHAGHALQHLFRMDFKEADQALRLALVEALQAER